MIEALLAVPAHLRRRLVTALETGLITSNCSASSLRSALGISDGCEAIATALGDLERRGIAGPAVVAWMRAVGEAVARSRRPDLVWSGPGVPGLHARDTRRVHEELLGLAEHSVWAGSFAHVRHGLIAWGWRGSVIRSRLPLSSRRWGRAEANRDS